jgi:hypothetical protein
VDWIKISLEVAQRTGCFQEIWTWEKLPPWRKNFMTFHPSFATQISFQYSEKFYLIIIKIITIMPPEDLVLNPCPNTFLKNQLMHFILKLHV